jgi:undecaprenyl-diphosphatase
MDQSPHLLRTSLETQNLIYRAPDRPSQIARLFGRLDAREVRFVRIIVGKSKRHPRFLAATVFLNLLGNGWLYLPLAVLLPLIAGWSAWRFMLAGSLSVIIAHSFYPWLKSRLARLRPLEFDPALSSNIKTLDRYSCPSGHCMTAAAVGIPLALAFPQTLLPIIIVWLMIAWSRISLGHHYPTDLLLGGLIGALVSLPISIFIL